MALVAVGGRCPATDPNEVAARVGPTGNSTASPHFQLMGAADPYSPKSIPCLFEGYLVQRDGGWQRVQGHIPRREQVRSVPGDLVEAEPSFLTGLGCGLSVAAGLML